MAEYKNIIIVETNEAGQPTNLRRLEDGDTISNERLNDDIRNAGTNATTALNTATSALDQSTAVSSTVYVNSGTWGAGGSPSAAGYQNWNEVSVGYSTFSGQIETSARNIETSARNRTASLDGSTNFPNTIADGTFDQVGELKVNLACAGFNIESPGTVDGVDIAARNLVLTNLETSSRNMSSIVDGSFTDLETSSRNMSSIVKGDIEALEAQVPSAAGFNNWNTIYGDRNNIKSVSASVAASDTAFLNGATPTLSNNLAGGGNDINNINKIRTDNVQTKLETGTLGVSGPNLSLFGEATVRIGKSSSNFATTDFKASADNWVGTYQTVYSNSGTWGGGGGAGNFEGSATASALTIGNSSSVAFSGTDGAALDLPTDGMVPVLDTAAARIKYQKLRGISIAEGAVELENLADGAVDDSKLANSLDINSHIAANNIGFGKLTLINAQTIVGNPEPTLGGPMQALTKAQTRNILGVSAGTTAPPSPDAGDLWYNTTDDELYTYDSGRGHWLGAPNYISMGKANAATAAGVGHFLYVGHQGTAATTQERGWLAPHDLVITGWRAHTKSSFDGWVARIDKSSGGSNTNGIVTTGTLGAVDTFSDFTLDVDLAAGDIIGVSLTTGSVTIDNSTVTIKVQRKGA